MPKQTKKQSKFKKFISWFKPTSPAKGALLFAIAFAVIGGSYKAYKSFAIDQNGSTRLAINLTPVNGSAPYVDRKGNKGPTRVIKIPHNGQVLGHFQIELREPKLVFMCASVRADESSSLPDPAIYFHDNANVYTPGSIIGEPGGLLKVVHKSTVYDVTYCIGEKVNRGIIDLEPVIKNVGTTTTAPLYVAFIKLIIP